jgi:hypothetical protein
LVTDRQSADELRVKGELTVSLDEHDPHRLIFNGLSGAGFALDSDWVRTGNQFVTTKAVVLENAFRDVTVIPEITGAATKVEIYGSPVERVGSFSKITWAGLPVTGSTSNTLSDVLYDAAGNFGVNVALPNLTWGMQPIASAPSVAGVG